MVHAAHRVTVLWMRMPLEPPAAVDVAVVPPPPQDDGAGEGGDDRDVGQRPADEVVAALRRPVDDPVQAGDHLGIDSRRTAFVTGPSPAAKASWAHASPRPSTARMAGSRTKTTTGTTAPLIAIVRSGSGQLAIAELAAQRKQVIDG